MALYGIKNYQMIAYMSLKKLSWRKEYKNKVSCFNSYYLMMKFVLTESHLIEADWDQVLLIFIKWGTNM